MIYNDIKNSILIHVQYLDSRQFVFDDIAIR